MPRALLYLLIRHILGSLRFRIQRLKQPKYLVGMLAIVGYLYFVFVGSFSESSRPKLVTQPEFAGLLVSLFLTLQIGLIWLLAGRATGLGFSEAETEILFAAPLTRQELIRYRLLKAQPGVLFSAIFLTLVLSISWKFPSPFLSFLAIFVLLNVIQTFQVLTAVLHGFWKGKSWAGLIKAAFLIALLLPFFLAASLPESDKGAVGSLLLWVEQTSRTSNWLAAHVWIGQFIISASLLEWAPRFAACLVILVFLYQSIVWSNVGFEEREMMQARERANTMRAMRTGRALTVKDRPIKPSLLPLAWFGSPWRAIAWKNITSLSRHLPRGFLFAIFYIAFVGILFFVLSGPQIPPLLASAILFSILALFLTFMGSSMVKEDLRSDLPKLDILRAFPVSPLEIIRGEVFGAAFLIGTITTFLLACSGAFLLFSAYPSLKSSSILVGTGFLICLASGVILLSFGIENTLTLILPAWVLPEAKSAQHSVSIDHMGRSIVLLIARFFFLTLFLIPPSLWMLLTSQLAILLENYVALATSAAGFAVIAWGETEIMIVLMAWLFEQLDASQEMLS